MMVTVFYDHAAAGKTSSLVEASKAYKKPLFINTEMAAGTFFTRFDYDGVITTKGTVEKLKDISNHISEDTDCVLIDNLTLLRTSGNALSILDNISSEYDVDVYASAQLPRNTR